MIGWGSDVAARTSVVSQPISHTRCVQAHEATSSLPAAGKEATQADLWIEAMPWRPVKSEGTATTPCVSLRKHLRQWLLRVLREFEDGQVTTHTHHLCDADAYELLPLFFTNYGQEEHDNSIFPIATNLFLCPAL
jgi:hypothetical protein